MVFPPRAFRARRWPVQDPDAALLGRARGLSLEHHPDQAQAAPALELCRSAPPPRPGSRKAIARAPRE